MDNNSQSAEGIGFMLSKITTEQFAIIEDNFAADREIEIQANFSFAADNINKVIGVFSSFIFECDKKQFIVIEAACHFSILRETWNNMIDKTKNQIVVSVNLLQHLAVLTVGTTRGILHAKTENTKFNHFYLPTINVTEFIKEDGVFKFGT